MWGVKFRLGSWMSRSFEIVWTPTETYVSCVAVQLPPAIWTPPMATPVLGTDRLGEPATKMICVQLGPPRLRSLGTHGADRLDFTPPRGRSSVG